MSNPRPAARPVVVTDKPPPAATIKSNLKPPVSTANLFDPKDLAPEDRITSSCNKPWPYSTGKIDLRDPIVTGSFHIIGVNYSRYENAKSVPHIIDKFHLAIYDDITSEVGGGTRPSDIVIKITPGTIDNVVLHYHTETDGIKVPVRSPKLVDAMWRMKVDYCIRARDAQRQQQIAMAMYSALNSEYNMAVKTAGAYARYLDEGHDVTKVRIVPGGNKEKASDARQASPLATTPAPLRPGLPSPARSLAMPAKEVMPAVPRGLIPPPLPKRSSSIRSVQSSPRRHLAAAEAAYAAKCPAVDYAVQAQAAAAVANEAASAATAAAEVRQAPLPPVGGLSATPSLSYAAMMNDIRKDLELEKLEAEIRSERLAIQESLQAATYAHG